jgi:hypothetical protein
METDKEEKKTVRVHRLLLEEMTPISPLNNAHIRGSVATPTSARRRRTTGKCDAPVGWDRMSSIFAPRLPRTDARGAAHDARAGYRALGSRRGRR